MRRIDNSCLDARSHTAPPPDGWSAAMCRPPAVTCNSEIEASESPGRKRMAWLHNVILTWQPGQCCRSWSRWCMQPSSTHRRSFYPKSSSEQSPTWFWDTSSTSRRLNDDEVTRLLQAIGSSINRWPTLPPEFPGRTATAHHRRHGLPSRCSITGFHGTRNNFIQEYII